VIVADDPDEAGMLLLLGPAVVADHGLGPVTRPPLPRRITEDQLGVVCWMGVLPGVP
jgi:hypothetical protein